MLFQFGYDINGKELDDIFKRFKEVAEKKKVCVHLWLPVLVVYGRISLSELSCSHELDVFKRVYEK